MLCMEWKNLNSADNVLSNLNKDSNILDHYHTIVSSSCPITTCAFSCYSGHDTPDSCIKKYSF